MPYLTPDSAPPATLTRTLVLPDDRFWIAIVDGALSELGYSYNFEAFGTSSPEETAAIFQLIFENYKASTMPPQTNADLVDATSFNESSASPLAMFTPPSSAIIREVWVNVTAAAPGGSPTVAVGVVGNASRYMGTGDSDLKSANLYVVTVFENVGVNPVPVVATITPSGQVFSAEIYVIYVNPS